MGKKAGILSIVFGIGAMGVVVYHLVETVPNLVATEARMNDAVMVSDLERALWMDYLDTAWMQVYLTWGIAGVALILGVVGILVGRKSGGAGTIAGVVGIVLAVVASALPYVVGVGAGKIG